MLSFPNAKINIGLQITNKRDDGYHDLNTIFIPIPYNDALEFIPATATNFQSIGLVINGNTADNLILKAYDLLKSMYPQIPALKIVLHKVIPMGAGLGGGSSDGAFMLKTLNKAYNLGIDDATLANYALALGSDCPFFLYNKPCFATGRGEVLSLIDIPMLANYSLHLVLPNIHISTAVAFKGINPQAPIFDLKDISTLAVEEWRKHINNDFETTVFAQFPTLAAIKADLYQQGAVYASMSGTGAAMYALMPKGKKANIENLDGQQIFFNDIVIK